MRTIPRNHFGTIVGLDRRAGTWFLHERRGDRLCLRAHGAGAAIAESAGLPTTEYIEG